MPAQVMRVQLMRVVFIKFLDMTMSLLIYKWKCYFEIII